MRTIAILNLKGGVGKTTTAISMAAVLARMKKTVFLIDADPQANLSSFFGMADEGKFTTTCDLIMGPGGSADDYVYDTRAENVYLLPSGIDLITADIASVRAGSDVKAIKNLLRALDEDAQIGTDDPDASAFDFCIIDCPPSFTAASVAAVYAADDIIIPVEIDAFSVHGMVEVLKQIESVRKIQPRVRVAGVLITKWHNAPAVIQGEAALRGSAVPVFEQTIRRSEKVAEALFMSRTLEEYSRTSAAARDYWAFVEEYLEGIT